MFRLAVVERRTARSVSSPTTEGESCVACRAFHTIKQSASPSACVVRTPAALSVSLTRLINCCFFCGFAQKNRFCQQPFYQMKLEN